MHMSRCRAVLALGMTAMVLPSLPAYPAQSAPSAASTEPAASLQLQIPVPTPVAASPVPAADTPSLNAQSRTTELKFEADPTTFYAQSRHDNHSYGMASGAVPSSALNLKSSNATRAGWQFSGRAGPVRWLGPLSGEGETKMRFGGRVPGQPRLPGLGLFNVSVHYAFE
jgi:hypothetical protein